MKLFKVMKDGGPLSKVTGYWLIEWKRVFSIVLLRFDNGSREAYHEHAFNALSWLLRGELQEYIHIPKHPTQPYFKTKYLPSFRPIWTPRKRFHKVYSRGTTWVLSFRGPWSDSWKEFDPATNKLSTLTHGRKVVQ